MGLKTKVKEYREKAGLKQSELAELVHARRETIASGKWQVQSIAEARYGYCESVPCDSVGPV